MFVANFEDVKMNLEILGTLTSTVSPTFCLISEICKRKMVFANKGVLNVFNRENCSSFLLCTFFSTQFIYLQLRLLDDRLMRNFL